jgi:hypothetical protein
LVSQLREDLLLCSSYLPLGVPNGLLLISHQYAVGLDAAIEEQGILEAVCVSTSLPEELREEGHVDDEPPDSGNKVDDDDFVHLDDDFLAELEDDREAEEAAAQ